jgi:hypothetical protein
MINGDLNYVADGIVDENQWATETRKILFLMKEPNDPGNENDWSLVKGFLDRGAVDEKGNPYFATWGMVSWWTRGLLDGFAKWTQVQQGFDAYSPDQRAEYLRRIAVVNLKKSGGEGQTPIGSLLERVELLKQPLIDQISSIAPDLLICCGTTEEVKQGLFRGELTWKKASNGVEWATHKDYTWQMFKYCHPQAHYPQNFIYTMLIEAVEEVFRRAAPGNTRSAGM